MFTGGKYGIDMEQYSIKEVMEANFKEIAGHLEDIKESVSDLNDKVGTQNGRVTRLEEWSNQAKVAIETGLKKSGEIELEYKQDRAKIITLISVMIFVGGILFTLANMLNNYRMQEKIQAAVQKSVQNAFTSQLEVVQ